MNALSSSPSQKESLKKLQVVKQIKGYLRQKFMYSQLALQEIDELVNKISKAKKHITPDDIKQIENKVKEKYPSRRSNTSQLSKNRSSVSPYLATQTLQKKQPSYIERNSLNSIAQKQSKSKESSSKLLNNLKIPRKGSIDSSQSLSKRINNETLVKLKENRSARKEKLKIMDSDKKSAVDIATLSTTPTSQIFQTRLSRLNQKSVPIELQHQKFSLRSPGMNQFIPASNKTSSEFNKSKQIYHNNIFEIAPLVKQSQSPNKPNIWAAIMIHDTLKYKQQQQKQKQKLRNQKLELKRFLQEQMRVKDQENFKKLELKKRQDQEIIKASKGLTDNEVAILNQRKNKLTKLNRDEYLKSFDVLSSKKKQVSFHDQPQYLRIQKKKEQEIEWQAAIREKQFYKSYQIKQIQLRKEKQIFHKRQLHDLINQKQKMKQVEKQLEQKVDRDALNFVAKSNEQRDFIVRNNQDKINQQHNLREDLFRLSNTNFSLQQKMKYDLIDERIIRQQIQQQQKKEQEESRMQARKNSLKEEMMRGLQQMSERKKMRENELRQSVNRDKENSKKLVQHFRRQIQLEQQRYQQEKQAKKKVMLTQYKNFMATKMTENSDCLLTPKQFVMNKKLMTEMGVQTDENQGEIANNLTNKRYQINPINL